MKQNRDSVRAEGMAGWPWVVVCGDSSHASAIAQTLGQTQGIQVSHLRPGQGDAVEHIAALAPSAVIVDQQVETVDLLLALLRRSIPIIGLDAEGRDVTVLKSCRFPVASLGELEAVMQRVKA